MPQEKNYTTSGFLVMEWVVPPTSRDVSVKNFPRNFLQGATPAFPDFFLVNLFIYSDLHTILD